MDHKVADLPSGPLDVYRKKASFNWKDMVLFIDGEESYLFKVTSVALLITLSIKDHLIADLFIWYWRGLALYVLIYVLFHLS